VNPQQHAAALRKQADTLYFPSKKGSREGALFVTLPSDRVEALLGKNYYYC
jgi:hypothetical protein